ncbi:MAG TPA: deoxyribonuclease V [Ktedonobacterales bacterium]|nr:deoxyribonuclease V [Ktedonobacterales bacterium]
MTRQTPETQHPWDVSVEEAIAIQRRLAPLAHAAAPIALDGVRLVAGVDVSYADRARGAVVVFRYPEMELVEQATVTRESVFPYVPGLLSFREVPIALDALARLQTTPDLLLCDGQGYAHPRRFGLACHLGLVTGLPSVGCAKSRLVGSYTEPGLALGDRSPLRVGEEIIGMVLRSRPRTRPLFISAGYRVTLEQAVDVTLACLRGYRMPEPTRAADRLAALARRAET